MKLIEQKIEDMNVTLKNNGMILAAMILIPFVYLATLWKQLPAIVPIHWNGSGVADGFGSKYSLLIVCALPLFVLAILKFALKVDPKKNLNRSVSKIPIVEMIITGFMSAIAVFAVYSALMHDSSVSFLMLLFGLFFMLFGNYLQTIPPNYFIGIRTPWTLQSDISWKATHRFTGRLWMLGGGLILLTSLGSSGWLSIPIFVPLLIIMAVVPLGYSYWFFSRVEE